MLDKNPNKSEILSELLGDTSTLRGIERFKDGNFDAAYAVWVPSARQGNKDAAYAIAAANAALKQLAADVSLPEDQRAKAQSALAGAPAIEFHDDTFRVRLSK